MARISIRENHSLSFEEAKKLVDELTSGLKSEWDVDCRYVSDNTIDVKRQGMKGKISIADDHVAVDMDLSIILNPLKKKIHETVQSKLRKALNRA